MNRVKPVSVFVADGYIYVIDDQGRIWKRHRKSHEWTFDGELPEDNGEPSVASVDIDMTQKQW